MLNKHGYENSFEPTFKDRNLTIFSKLPVEIFKHCGDAVKKYFPIYAAELQGLAKAFNRNDVTYDYLATWAYALEFSHSDIVAEHIAYAECTGVLIQCPDGSILHGRNMDQAPTNIRNMTLHLKLYSKGV